MALAALKGVKTLQELAERFDVDASQLVTWEANKDVWFRLSLSTTVYSGFAPALQRARSRLWGGGLYCG